MTVSNLQITAEPDSEKDILQLTFTGEIDRNSMPYFREVAEEQVKTMEQKNLVLDIKNLQFINSKGIGYISDLYNRLSTKEKNVMIIGASERILDILQLVGLNQIIPCCNTIEECLEKI